MSPTKPVLLGVERPADGQLQLRFSLPPDLFYFQGHFPEAPILPGVAQIDWAVACAKEYLPLKGDFAGLKALKFQLPLLPGAEFQLELDHKPEKNSAAFRFLSAKGRHSSGTLLFG